MRIVKVARKRSGNLFVFIQKNIENKSQLRLFGSKNHVSMYWILCQYPLPRMRRSDKLRIMIVDNRLTRSDTRQDTLASARKPRKKMRLDKSFRHHQLWTLTLIRS